MSKTIAFLSSGHSPFDDRIYYHFADSLHTDYNVVIITSTAEIIALNSNIRLDCFDGNNYSKNKKIKIFQKKLSTYKPDLIICSEPLPIIASKKYKKQKKNQVKIVYDVTEWYPSKKNVEGLFFIKKICKALTLWIFNYYSSFFVDAFIFGENDKSIPYRRLFPFKKWEIITYYPNLKYIFYPYPLEIKKEICLGYTGRISIEKGIENFFKVVKMVQLENPDISVQVKIIGQFVTEKDKYDYQQITKNFDITSIKLIDYIKFEDFTKALEDIHILFDLRKIDYENNRCLPIKIFYYAACGKPVIYSNLKSIQTELSVKNFGYLVNPEDSETISEYVKEYINNPGLYLHHCLNARELSKNLYNWDIITKNLSDFIKSLVKKNANK